MSPSILATKLYIPPPRPKVVLRPRLIEWLNDGLHRKMTLISAPAGFGKTTLASYWVTSREQPAAWLSLDEGDNDLTRFLSYLVAALQTLDSSKIEGSALNFGEGTLDMLQSPQPSPIESILTALLNEIAAIPGSFILVLDDYHLIETHMVDDAITFLLEHLPPQMHLVIATREDPHLPLARLRVRSQLTEIRAADLRFTLSEATEFFNQVMGLNLSEEEIAALERRTEGWIAGLQMAALSMQGRADTAAFIDAFTGSHYFVLDYLVEEVLQSQPAHIRSFLLQTSILDRLSGPLCDAVRFGEAPSSSFATALTWQEDGKAMLEELERGNLFVIPLDDKRHWYRYHHLFADVLQAHALEEQADQLPVFHLRASEWYEKNNQPSDAIRHALAAEDFERAADLVELAMPAMDWSFQSAAWLGWVQALPDELIRTRPVLSVGYAVALLTKGKLEAVEARLQDAERWLEPAANMNDQPNAPSTKMVVLDEEQFRSLPGKIATARAAHAQILGDMPGTMKYAQRAFELLPESDFSERGRTAALLGVAYWTNGDLEAAHRTFVDFMANMRQAGNILVAISGTFILADIRMAQGRLHEAVRSYQNALQIATVQGEPVLRGTADLYLGLAELRCQQGDLVTASRHLQTSKKLGEQAMLPDLQYRSCVARARIKTAHGDLDGALDLLAMAEQAVWGPVTDLLPLAALRTRIWVAQGRLAEALAWTRERDLSFDDDLSYHREFEHITLARVLIAHYKNNGLEGIIHEAQGLLARLLKAAEEGARIGSMIEILLLVALAHQAHGDIPPALVSLERALILAEPEGYVRIFVDEGPPMAALLQEAAKHDSFPGYVTQLQAAFDQVEGRAVVNQHLVEPLSPREIDVLLLVAKGLTNRQISERLFLALDTVKGHNRRIYEKLGVNNRTQAVNKARSLGIIPYK